MPTTEPHGTASLILAFLHGVPWASLACRILVFSRELAYSRIPSSAFVFTAPLIAATRST